MKKAYVKRISMFLAVIFLISMMPFAAFAADDGHDHDGTCCEETNVAVPYVTCTHPTMLTYYFSEFLKEDSVYHWYTDYVTYTCNSCHYTSTEATGNIWKGVHNYILSNGGTSAACTVCGHLRDA